MLEHSFRSFEFGRIEFFVVFHIFKKKLPVFKAGSSQIKK